VTLLLLLHEICRGFAIVNLTGAMDLARELEDSLGRRRLARIDVGEDTDISINAKVFHFTALLVSFLAPTCCHTKRALKAFKSENPACNARWVHVNSKPS
jgi:hypothetical protein